MNTMRDEGKRPTEGEEELREKWLYRHFRVWSRGGEVGDVDDAAARCVWLRGR